MIKKKLTLAEIKAAREKKIAGLERRYAAVKKNGSDDPLERKRLRTLLWYYKHPEQRRTYLLRIGKAAKPLPGMKAPTKPVPKKKK